MLAMIVVGLSPLHAVEAVSVRSDAAAIDLTDSAERHRTDSDRLLVSAAPGPDGIIRRMDVRAREGNTNWAVFALANPGDEQIERLIVVPHYRMVGSGVFWPDLGRSRVASITSSGERPDRQDSATADIFRITLDPGSRRARLGGARLYRHRLRLLGRGVRAVTGLRANLACIGRGDTGCHAG